MDTKWLHDFLILAETRNFTRASELRFTTQSAFSRRIKALEDWVGTQLFDRRSYPVTLTKGGEVFLPFAKDILGRLDQSRGTVRQHSSRADTVTTIATTHSLAGIFLPAWLRQIEAEAGPINIGLFTTSFEECVSALLAHGVQFMICHCSRELSPDLDSEEYPSLTIGLDALIPLCAPDGRGEPRYRPDVDDHAPFLAYAETSRLGQIIAMQFKDRQDVKVQSSPTFVSSYADVLQSMAVHGYGFAWLLNNETRSEVNEHLLVRAVPADWDIPLEVRIFRGRAPLGERGEQVWRAISDQALSYD